LESGNALFTYSLLYINSEFDPEYTLVAKSFQKSKNNKNLFFGHLDFKDGQAVYQKVKNNMS
jgi:hypothetical protein